MFETKKIAFIGGDARMIFAAREFVKGGFSASLFGFDILRGECGELEAESAKEALEGADFAVLPPVVSRDGENIHAPFSEKRIPACGLDFGGTAVFAGVSGNMINGAVYNYAEREAFAVRNAVPTAEAALKIAMEETGETLCGMRACVLGFGRIGTVLTKDLTALGAKTTVFARRSEARALAVSFSAEAHSFELLESEIGSFDCIFNTVPQRMLGAGALSKIRPGAPFIELASAPGGADEALARSLSVKFVPAGGLPGKIMPKSAGKIIYETIKEMMKEEKLI